MSDETKKDQAEASNESGDNLSDQQLEEASGGEIYEFPGEYAQRYDGIDSAEATLDETSVKKETR